MRGLSRAHLSWLGTACRTVWWCCKKAPISVFVGTCVTVLVGSIVLAINVHLTRLLTLPGTITANIVGFWLLLRLITRFLVFPGSTLVWRRSTEASYRQEMSKQYAGHFQNLREFVLFTAGHMPSSRPSVELAWTGCLVLRDLAHNFRVQHLDQVQLTPDQTRLKLLVEGVNSWVGNAKVCCGRNGSRSGESQVPLTDWLQKASEGAGGSKAANLTLAQEFAGLAVCRLGP